ncbi:MAG TPA: xanthine dehydrogenase family protein subunit M [Syntrophales bacterium]|nr:xanthine dehydrogenase family protein subunit M [Syntrophales bacterium]HRU89331.1 xanthine dehydrogenase family protein subunit M [Syntrophales bacterium]
MKRVFLPESMDELWSVMAAAPDARVYAGGTDLLVAMRAGEIAPASLICLERLTEIQGVRETGEELWLGAATTHAALLSNDLILRHLPLLAQALRTLGSPPIRNMGTIGGNICTASPAGDTLPPLYVLDAEVELQQGTNSRRLPVREFITGPGRTRLADGEIMTGICIRKPSGANRQRFEKIGRRRALACAIASLAALLRVTPDGVVESARLAWGSVGPTVVTSPAAEAALTGKPLSRETLFQAAVLVRRDVSPMDDLRASAAYRREAAGNLLLRLLPSG